MLTNCQMEELQDWRALRPTEWLAPVKMAPGSNLRWMYETGTGASQHLGGILVESKGEHLVRRINGHA